MNSHHFPNLLLAMASLSVAGIRTFNFSCTDRDQEPQNA